MRKQTVDNTCYISPNLR